ncbi:MAG: hypothetical protein EPN70_17570 [Paraburkholderia sp.]|uniref:hypothetical protein n=1 Tax=Paraburkholderia sp. TaxID=1926495 RepID=UPI0011F575CA|nr:hypothetical protein [Paraburkholderia sp.]TAM02189.1 MAG: hypothetical protein EPN70_17570 [Paraburkholderia sp.]TAM28123.1 MAG: hypothetical protein EPN59_18350 [Paraburkholderia sp.]
MGSSLKSRVTQLERELSSSINPLVIVIRRFGDGHPVGVEWNGEMYELDAGETMGELEARLAAEINRQLPRGARTLRPVVIDENDFLVL